MSAPKPNAPEPLGFYRDADGWHTDRSWNEHPATACELEAALLALQAAHGIGLQLVHHFAVGNLKVADGIEPVEELSVIQTLEHLRALVWPEAPKVTEVLDARTF